MLMFYSCVHKNSVLFALPAGITNIRMSGIWVGQGGGWAGLVFVKSGGEAAAATRYTVLAAEMIWTECG